MTIDSSNMLQLGQFQQQSSRNNLEALQRKTTGTAGLSPEGSANSEDDKLRKACSDFQAIFIKQMLDTMRKTVQKGGLLEGGQAEEIFEDMLYDEYAQKMSETANLGLDDMIYIQLSTKNFI